MTAVTEFSIYLHAQIHCCGRVIQNGVRRSDSLKRCTKTFSLYDVRTYIYRT